MSRYHLTAKRTKRVDGIDIKIDCPVDHPYAVEFLIFDDDLRHIATCGYLDNARIIVDLANTALDAADEAERIIGAIDIATQQTHATVVDAVGSLLEQRAAVCGMLPDVTGVPV